MAVLLTGREPADSIRSDVREKASALGGRPTCLAVIVVGDDPSSAVYVASKEKACARAGFESRVLRFGAGEAEETVLARIAQLNADPAVDGILCQLPVPPHMSPSRIASAIDPRKDVDGFHPFNVGRLWRGERTVVPCTPLGVMRLLDHYGLRVSGLRAVVLGRSNIVGKPMAALLLKEDATVTLAHSRTPGLPGLCSQADILVTATGMPGMVGSAFVKPGAIVIDVGITRTPEGLKGDVLFEEVEPACGWITPVPGGVGLLTIAMLLSNTLDCRLALQDFAGATS